MECLDRFLASTWGSVLKCYRLLSALGANSIDPLSHLRALSSTFSYFTSTHIWLCSFVSVDIFILPSICPANISKLCCWTIAGVLIYMFGSMMCSSDTSLASSHLNTCPLSFNVNSRFKLRCITGDIFASSRLKDTHIKKDKYCATF